jgi:hypothetical protein
MQAQQPEPLSIDTIFLKYGKCQGATMLNLTTDVLGESTLIERYKCLIINGETKHLNYDAIVTEVEASIKRDFNRRPDLHTRNLVREETVNGRLQTVYYHLAYEPFPPTHEYILYSNKNCKLTLIYLRGNFMENLLANQLAQLKKLFIKINN